MNLTLHTHPVDMEGKFAAIRRKLVSFSFFFFCYFNISCVHSQVASVYYNGDSNPVQCSGKSNGQRRRQLGQHKKGLFYY